MISGWLAGIGVPAIDIWLGAAITGIGLQFLILRRWWRTTAEDGPCAPVREECTICDSTPPASPHEAVIAAELRGDVALAADHIESIRALLEVSRLHQQPIPAVALRNLDLVLKHLRKIQRKLDPAPELDGIDVSQLR